jgi:uncharacterized SAM-binding protein YcdF (DUF218 family)
MEFIGLAAMRIALLYAGVCLVIAGFALLQAAFEPVNFARADVIVVPGAGMDADGTLHRSSIGRVEKAVALFQDGTAARLHFSGGGAVPDGPSAGAQMAALAQASGVPATAISIEGRSQSTLQNALFSQDALTGATRIIIVTEGFHLARSWLSFRWAGWTAGQRPQIALAHSTIFRKARPGRSGAVMMVLREGAAWPFNVARAAVWHAAQWTGTSRERRDSWLR